jgi:hypothetical protein
VTRRLGIAVDAENLENALGGVFGVIGCLDPAGAELAVVGAKRAQDALDRYRLPPAWLPVTRRITNTSEPEAADTIITELLIEWSAQGRVVVLASMDGGFAHVLSQVRARGTHAFVLGLPRTARRLRMHVPVLDVIDRAGVDRARRTIEAARAES